MVEEGCERRPLPSHFDVGRAEVPDHRAAKHLGQHLPVPDLNGHPACRVMPSCLPVKSDDLSIRET